MTRHGELYLRDQTPPRSTYYDRGRFGRLFGYLPPFAQDEPKVRAALEQLGAEGGLMDAKDPDPTHSNDPNVIIGVGNPDNEDNPRKQNGRHVMTAGMTFLGQFLDHDMTFDPTSSLERQSDPEAIANFRTPLLELDSVYGSGRAASPHLYDKESGRTKFLIDPDWPRDLPRNSQNDALIGDPRNDENVIVSQLHLAFLKFHNAAVGEVTKGDKFTEAQRLVRWHYQWIIIHEYLAKTVGEDLVTEILEKGRRFYDWRNEPFIPVEFSVAAFRFGHSQVRPGYIANHGRLTETDENGLPLKQFVAPIFDLQATGSKSDPDDLRGGVRARRRFVDWDTFFDFGNDKLRPNKRIDTKLSTVLFQLPRGGPGLPGDLKPGETIRQNPNSLAQRNLLRHLTFSLPSGQAIARAMGEDPLTIAALKDGDIFEAACLHESTPLWYYILHEAEENGGGQLGKVGGRIVAEVMLGLLQGDRGSFLVQHPKWKPLWGTNDNFTMRDLLCMAGLTPPDAAQDICKVMSAPAAAADTTPVSEDSTQDRKGPRNK